MALIERYMCELYIFYTRLWWWNNNNS